MLPLTTTKECVMREREGPKGREAQEVAISSIQCSGASATFCWEGSIVHLPVLLSSGSSLLHHLQGTDEPAKQGVEIEARNGKARSKHEPLSGL